MSSSGTYVTDLSDLASQRAIGDVDGGADLDAGGEGLVRAHNLVLVALIGEVGDDLEALAGNNVDGLAVLEQTSADLGTLGIEQKSALLVRSLLEGFTQVLNTLAVALMVTVREVQSGNVHTSIKHLDEHVDIPAGRTTETKFG